jgi:MurNAc alpha-1-phosphate uridylyltransferase
MSDALFPVVILAGGLATRLGALTAQQPKSLLKINGEAFISHQLRLLQQQGVKKVFLCISHYGAMIEDYLRTQEFDLTIETIFDGNKLLGTAGAIKKALPLLPENFFVLNGDSYLRCDYFYLQNCFLTSGKLALMSVFKNQGLWDKSNVEYADDTIIAYNKLIPTDRMHYIDYGISIFRQKAFRWVPENQSYDLSNLNHRLIQKKELAGVEVKQRFYEVGSFAGIKDFENFLTPSA